jgi:hypothetical protein
VSVNRDPNLVKIETMRARITVLEAALTSAGLPVPGGNSSSAGASGLAGLTGDARSEMLSKQNAIYDQELKRVSLRLKEVRGALEEAVERTLATEVQAAQYREKVEGLLEGRPELAEAKEQLQSGIVAPADVKLVLVMQRKIAKLKGKLKNATDTVSRLQSGSHSSPSSGTSSGTQNMAEGEEESPLDSSITSNSSYGTEAMSDSGSDMSDEDVDIDDKMNVRRVRAYVWGCLRIIICSYVCVCLHI